MPLHRRPTSLPPAEPHAARKSQLCDAPRSPVSNFGVRHSDFRGVPRRGFTLTEILVVIVIIVLILGMAVPALRFITGSRSQAGAANMISAELARARNDAIGLQIPTGVCFYQDATTGRTMMAEVQQVQPPAWSGTNAYPVGSYVNYTPAGVAAYYVAVNNILSASTATPNATPTTDTTDWVEIADNTSNTKVVSTSAGFPYMFDQLVGTDAEPLPSGVGAQVLTDVGLNVASNPPVAYAEDRYLPTGVIEFDANGRLVAQPFWISRYGLVGKALGLNATGKYDIAWNATKSATVPLNPAAESLTAAALTTDPDTLVASIGLVVYDRDAYGTQFGNVLDLIIDDGSYNAAKDNWLDTNATPLLVNRYNGTLMNNQ